MRKWLVSGILALLILIFGGLIRFWNGFAYFVFVSITILSVYWVFELIASYIYHYKKCYEERFKIYIADIINTTNYTSEDVEKGLTSFKKKFNKYLLKEKTIEWLKIAFACGVFISSIILMFTY